jgi:hypothetical protein
VEGCEGYEARVVNLREFGFGWVGGIGSAFSLEIEGIDGGS